jgi:hypothetical protein
MTGARNHPVTKGLRGCTGKKRHATAGNAVAFASRMVKRTGSVAPYECQHCKGWHLTSRTPGRLRREKDNV